MRISDWSSDVCSSDLSTISTENSSGLIVPAAGTNILRRSRQRCERSVIMGELQNSRSTSRFPQQLLSKNLPLPYRLWRGGEGGMCSSKNHPTRSEDRRVGKECVSMWRSHRFPSY